MRLYRCELWDHVNLPQTQCQADKGAALAISAPEHGGSRAVIVAIAHAKRAVLRSLRLRLCFATAARVDVALMCGAQNQIIGARDWAPLLR